MPITPELKSSYEAVLKDLESERATVHEEVASLQRKLRELDQGIASLYRRLGVPAVTAARAATQSRFPSDKKYADISVHWALLHFLLCEAKTPMTTSEIADGLKAGGVQTRAANFTNNVSAVLSSNMRPKGEEEVEMIDGRWRLTETGRNKATHVIMSEKFRRACPWLSETSFAMNGQ